MFYSGTSTNRTKLWPNLFTVQHSTPSFKAICVFRCVQKIARSNCELRHVRLSICLCVCPCKWTTWLPVEIWHLRIFQKYVEKIRFSFNSDKSNGTLHEEGSYLWYLAKYFLKFDNFRQSCRENGRKIYMFNIIFQEILPFMSNKVKETGHRWQYNRAHIHCIVDK